MPSGGRGGDRPWSWHASWEQPVRTTSCPGLPLHPTSSRAPDRPLPWTWAIISGERVADHPAQQRNPPFTATARGAPLVGAVATPWHFTVRSLPILEPRPGDRLINLLFASVCRAVLAAAHTALGTSSQPCQFRAGFGSPCRTTVNRSTTATAAAACRPQAAPSPLPWQRLLRSCSTLSLAGRSMRKIRGSFPHLVM